jgi:adenosylhomocysteine nucleosidase
MPKILVICPLKAELNALRSTLVSNDVVLLVGGRGKTQMAIQTMIHLSQHPDAELVVCAGTSGALDSQVAIGDVVIGTSSIEHDWKQIDFTAGTSGLSFRSPPAIETRDSVIQKLKDHLDFGSSEFAKIHFGSIASGDEDVVTKDRADEIHKNTNALVVAWEGAGFAKACANQKIPWVEIRVVTDLADHNTPQDFHTNLDMGMKSIGRILSLIAD